MRIIDNIIALRIVYLLVTPFENTDAFKLGLIDDAGKPLKKAKTPEENNATSMLHRLVWRLKRMINLVPGGSTKIGSLAAAYLLMREAYEQEYTENQLEEAFLSKYEANFALITEELDSEIDELFYKLSILEDAAPVNSVDGGGVSNPDLPLVGKIQKRKSIKVAEVKLA